MATIHYQSSMCLINETTGDLLQHNSPCSAQAGINRGDGTNFYALPGSGNSDVLLLSNTSYVNISGVWIFQVDNDEVSIGGMQSCVAYSHYNLFLCWYM